MQVNEAIYGNSENWLDAVINYSSNPHKTKLANFMNQPLSAQATSVSQIWRGVSENLLVYGEPIDKSLSYCGLGSECSLSHTSYIGYQDGVKILRTEDRGLTNFAFFERRKRTNSYVPDAYTIVPITDLLRKDKKNSFAWIENPENNFCINNSPITGLPPKNLCLLVQVYAGTSSSGGAWIDFDTFINNTSYTYIGAARFIPYFSNNGATPRELNAQAGSPDSGEYNFFLNLLENYKIPEWNDFDYNIYSYVNNIFFGNMQGGFTGYYQTNNDYINIAFLTPNAKDNLHISTEGQPAGNYNIYISRYDEIGEEILKSIACFGLYFTTKSSVATNGSLTDPDMYIGILNDNGVGHGDYLRGSATAQAPQNQYDDMHDVPYDPDSADTTNYVNDTLFYGNLVNGAFTQSYILTEAKIRALADELFTALSEAPAGEEIERYNQTVFLTQNPIDCIVSLYKFPCDISWSGLEVPIKLGTYECNTEAEKLIYSTGTYNFKFSKANNNTLRPHFDKSFLDYEPYTKAEITIPFCGTIEMPVTYIYDYDDIDIKLIIDYITGACSAYIMSRGITLASVSGNCGVSLPVTGLQSATLDSAIFSAAHNREQKGITNALGITGGLAAAGIGVITGGVGAALIGGAAALTSIIGMTGTDKQLEYELEHMNTPLRQIGSASSSIAQTYDMRCKMRIIRPQMSDKYDPAVYADTIGFACLINTTVKKLHGFTVGNINLDGVNCTAAEKELIKNAFASGVYLPQAQENNE